MAHSNGDLHVYFRKIEQGERTSLSVLAQQIFHGARVLDLGIGSGALGAYLHEELGCTVDGVTYNAAEADVARAHYRRIEVADLETCALDSLFDAAQYDFIVCADVLEHLRRPERVLATSRGLLAADGCLLISIPNASYAGLVAELLHGEFRYREEGLLDNTHLRFFTRRSLSRFMGTNGWTLDKLEALERELPASEFKVEFDQLPPAVARYMLALPDAMTYQFIGVARPSGQPQAEPPHAMQGVDGHALFTAELFLGVDGQYSEERKLTTRGVIGEPRQTVVFELPQTDTPFTHLKLDPADRPGFLYLYSMSLLSAEGSVLWDWRATEEGIAQLANARNQDLLLRPPWPSAAGAMVVLYANDPWVELPIPASELRAASSQAGAQLRIELGWPMSADYLAAAEDIAALRLEVTRLRDAKARADVAPATEASRAGAVQRLPRTAVARLPAGGAGAQAQSITAAEILQIQALRKQNRLLQELRRAHVRDVQALRDDIARQAADRGRLSAENSHLAAQNAEVVAQYAATQARAALLAAEREQLMQHLQEIRNSRIFRATRPLVRSKLWLMRALRGARTANPVDAPSVKADEASVVVSPDATPVAPGNAYEAAQPAPIPSLDPSAMHAAQAGNGEADFGATPALHAALPVRTVDVIIPAYRGLADTRRCVESVLRSKCDAAMRVIVINDGSPEADLTDWLRQAAEREPSLTLLENPQNLGFVATANRGMALSESSDVVLLNSDAEVANDWLDRLQRAAYSAERVASVTPFSNNATICSYPRFCEANPLPEGFATAQLDALFAVAHAGQVLDIPTGVGFCMYVRRDCIAEVGMFDVDSFGMGYGEENDFCRRALAAGWRNLHALDVFVAHSGGTSFGDAKGPRELAAMQTLRTMHPDYEPEVQAFVAADPARSFRQTVDMARLQASQTPRILSVVHNLGGGTLRHMTELTSIVEQRAIMLSLTPGANRDAVLKWVDPRESLELAFHIPEAFDDLVQALKVIGISHIHVHHLLGHGLEILELPQRLQVPYDFTAHDYHVVCPQVSLTYPGQGYCGELGVQQCGNCLHLKSAPNNFDIVHWRAVYGGFAARASHLLVPSRDAARRFARYLPMADIRLAPHTDLDEASLPEPAPALVASRANLRIVVIGAISAIKGADTLEAVALDAAAAGAPLEFHLVGYAYRSLHSQPHASLTVHGPYAEHDLPRLLERLKPDVVWFPALWPETYSYTLSACLKVGVPVVAPDLGAFAERLDGRRWTWLKRWDTPAAEWLQFFQQIRHENFETGQEPERPHADAAVGADALVYDWSYSDDYLQDLPIPQSGPAASHAFVLSHQTGRPRAVDPAS